MNRSGSKRMMSLFVLLWLVFTVALAAITVPSTLTLSNTAVWAAVSILIGLLGVYVLTGTSRPRRQ